MKIAHAQPSGWLWTQQDNLSGQLGPAINKLTEAGEAFHDSQEVKTKAMPPIADPYPPLRFSWLQRSDGQLSGVVSQ